MCRIRFREKRKEERGKTDDDDDDDDDGNVRQIPLSVWKEERGNSQRMKGIKRIPSPAGQ